MDRIRLIYIGDRFYDESGSRMSPLYTEDGARYDYGLMQSALRQGFAVEVRQATADEIAHYDVSLAALKEQRARRRAEIEAGLADRAPEDP